MQTFLDQPEAAFYHVCALERWESIIANGLYGQKNKIFVSRVGEMPVLAAIALEQIPDIYECTGIAAFKLPQALSHFSPAEIFKDNQTKDERTKVFQNIITRDWIPPENVEKMMRFPFLGNGLDILTGLAAQANMYYADHAIYQRALSLAINELPEFPLDDYWRQP